MESATEPRGLPAVLLIADDDLDGWQRYPECVADQPNTPIDDEIEGDLLQYSSGTTGRPKGIKRELPHLPPAEAPSGPCRISSMNHCSANPAEYTEAMARKGWCPAPWKT